MNEPVRSTSAADDDTADAPPDAAQQQASVSSWREAMFEGTLRFEAARVVAFGLGHVYQAFDRERGMRVAIKEFRYHDGVDQGGSWHERSMLQRIRPPAHFSAHEIFVGAQEIAYVVEWLEGIDFRSHVGSPARDRASLQRAFAGLVRALVALHDAGFVHRNLKPEHALVTPEGRVVLLALDLTVPAGWERDGAIVGTAPYVSPELLRGCPVSPASDLYAAGVMLFEALTGRLPFDGPNIMTILSRKLFEEAPAPSSVAEAVPEDLDHLCLALLDRDPAKRPSAGQVLAVLEMQ